MNQVCDANDVVALFTQIAAALAQQLKLRRTIDTKQSERSKQCDQLMLKRQRKVALEQKIEEIYGEQFPKSKVRPIAGPRLACFGTAVI